jgi:hypothetical protein
MLCRNCVEMLAGRQPNAPPPRPQGMPTERCERCFNRVGTLKVVENKALSPKATFAVSSPR